MKKNVSLEKQSKKARREYYSKRRRTWGTLNPVTRSVPSGKMYNRKKAKQKMRRTSFRSDDGFETGFLFLIRKEGVSEKRNFGQCQVSSVGICTAPFFTLFTV